jgi:F-box/leucine-rich repeat protein 2/20
VDLSWCWHITDEGLDNIVNHCRNFQKMTLIGLDLITGKIFKDVGEKLPRLHYLDLCNCSSIIDDLLKAVAKENPSLSIVNYYGNIMMS